MIVGVVKCLTIILSFIQMKTANPEPFLTLLYSDNVVHNDLNNKFYKTAQSMGFNVLRHDLITNDVTNTINASQTFRNVINLRVPEPAESENLTIVYEAFIKSNLMCAVECILSKTTVLISQDILKYYPNIFEIIAKQKLVYEVLVCHPEGFSVESIKNEKQLSYLTLRLTDDCDDETQTSSALAVLTYKPLADTTTPSIFYQMPYFYPEYKDQFPNYIDLSTPWQPMKYALLSLLKNMQWYRVAVLSDDTEYSYKFLEELSKLFIEESIVYTALACEPISCDFGEALQTLKNSHARIIIVNVDSKNTDKLLSSLSTNDLGRIKWIVRDWPFENKEINNVMQDVHSIQLYPVYKNWPNTEPYVSAILKGLTIIKNANLEFQGDKEQIIRKFKHGDHRRFNEFTKVRAFITHRINQQSTVISTMTIDGDQVKDLTFRNTYKTIPLDIPQGCIVRRNEYYRPCGTVELLLLMTVVLMFTLMILIIIMYFNHLQRIRSYNRLN